MPIRFSKTYQVLHYSLILEIKYHLLPDLETNYVVHVVDQVTVKDSDNAFDCYYYISNDPNFRPKHPGVPDGSDGSDGTSYPLTKNYTLPVAQATGRVPYLPPSLCGDVYASSERHVCYTLRRGCSYAEAVYTTPGDRRQAWEHLGAPATNLGMPATNLGAPATCLGAPRITVMDSVCILIYVSMYLCIYIATHLHTLYLDWLVCRIYTPRHPVHLRYPFDRACLRCTWRRRLIELRDALGDWDRVNSEMHLEAGIERVWWYTWMRWSCELAGRNRASLEIHWEAVI